MTSRTNITVIDDDLWKWAKKRAIDLDCNGVSEYIFMLIKREREKDERRKLKQSKNRGG